jgi:hypothetical protein
MRGSALLIGLVALGLGTAGCGGGDDRTGASGSGGPTNALDDELSVPTAGWETDFSMHTVPLSEFQSGGPGKDGIPSLDERRFVSVEEADDWLADREPVVELSSTEWCAPTRSRSWSGTRS